MAPKRRYKTNRTRTSAAPCSSVQRSKGVSQDKSAINLFVGGQRVDRLKKDSLVDEVEESGGDVGTCVKHQEIQDFDQFFKASLTVPKSSGFAADDGCTSLRSRLPDIAPRFEILKIEQGECGDMQVGSTGLEIPPLPVEAPSSANTLDEDMNIQNPLYRRNSLCSTGGVIDGVQHTDGREDDSQHEILEGNSRENTPIPRRTSGDSSTSFCPSATDSVLTPRGSKGKRTPQRRYSLRRLRRKRHYLLSKLQGVELAIEQAENVDCKEDLIGGGGGGDRGVLDEDWRRFFYESPHNRPETSPVFMPSDSTYGKRASLKLRKTCSDSEESSPNCVQVHQLNALREARAMRRRSFDEALLSNMNEKFKLLEAQFAQLKLNPVCRRGTTVQAESPDLDPAKPDDNGMKQEHNASTGSKPTPPTTAPPQVVPPVQRRSKTPPRKPAAKVERRPPEKPESFVFRDAKALGHVGKKPQIAHCLPAVQTRSASMQVRVARPATSLLRKNPTHRPMRDYEVALSPRRGPIRKPSARARPPRRPNTANHQRRKKMDIIMPVMLG